MLPTSKKGFTLIELLVVIAIIGVLSSVVLASLNSARVKGRDAKRASEMRQIQTAVELYASDNGGKYPNSNNLLGDAQWAGFAGAGYSTTPIINPAATNLTEALRPYLSSVPADPKGLSGDSGYLYRGNGTQYCILIWKTPENLNNFSKNLIPSTRCTTWDSSGTCTQRCTTWDSSGTCTAFTSVGALNAIYTATEQWARDGC